jgi:hypothetical protein
MRTAAVMNNRNCKAYDFDWSLEICFMIEGKGVAVVSLTIRRANLEYNCVAMPVISDISLHTRTLKSDSFSFPR